MNNQRYGMIFDTGVDTHYYFDAGTGKVISCSKDEKEFIGKILSNKITLDEARITNKVFGEFVEANNLFSNKEWEFIYPTKEEIIKSIDGNCQQIVLELTEACNLRCEYCIYNEHHPDYRGFTNKRMNFETAKKAIDIVLKDFKGKEFALTFYGGEPLINFELLKESIEYAKLTYPKVKFSYSFTTNLTLLTQEMVEYLKTIEDIDILCSIDGPQEIHDKYRKDISGAGTFVKVIENFNLLLAEFYNQEKNRNLIINCVMVPPYTKEKLNDLYSFFYHRLKVPKAVSCNYSYVDLGNMEVDKTRFTAAEQRLEVSPIEEWAADDFQRQGEESKFYNLINQELYRVANRAISKEGVITEGFMHGNCIPGQRRIYVTVDGEFRTCEKVGNIPSLGNCYIGYDFDAIYKIYIEDYVKYYADKCNNCCVRNMCGVCYDNTIVGKREVSYQSGELCNTSRELVRDMFVNYFRLFEDDEQKLASAMSKLEFK